MYYLFCVSRVICKLICHFLDHSPPNLGFPWPLASSVRSVKSHETSLPFRDRLQIATESACKNTQVALRTRWRCRDWCADLLLPLTAWRFLSKLRSPTVGLLRPVLFRSCWVLIVYGPVKDTEECISAKQEDGSNKPNLPKTSIIFIDNSPYHICLGFSCFEGKMALPKAEFWGGTHCLTGHAAKSAADRGRC